MSSAIYYEPATPIPLAEWEQFCAEHDVVYRPNTAGQNVFYAGQVEITFGGCGEHGTLDRSDGTPMWDTARPPDRASKVTVSTYFMGSGMPAALCLATAMCRRWGGELHASPEFGVPGDAVAALAESDSETTT